MMLKIENIRKLENPKNPALEIAGYSSKIERDLWWLRVSDLWNQESAISTVDSFDFPIFNILIFNVSNFPAPRCKVRLSSDDPG